MKKRILSFALAVTLCCGVFMAVPMTASAASEVIYSDDRISITLTPLEKFNQQFDPIGIMDADAVYPFNDGYAVAYDASLGKSVMIDRQGNPITALTDAGWYKFGGVEGRNGYNSYFSEGLIYAQNTDGRSGYIDISGNLKIPGSYNVAGPFHDGLATVSLGRNTYGIIDKSGSVVIPLKYGAIGSLSEGLFTAEAEFGAGYGYINKQGIAVIDFQKSWAWAGPFKDGLARVRNRDLKYGFINTSGELVIPFKYSSAGDFSEGLAWVIEEDMTKPGATGKSYYIDKTGKVIIETMGFGSEFHDGVAETAGGYIDKTGKVLIPGGTKLSNGLQFRFGIIPYGAYLGSDGFNDGLAVEDAFYGEYKWYLLELTVKMGSTSATGRSQGAWRYKGADRS